VTGVATRSVPDLAFDADPESGAVILVRGQALTVGGTSMAAPMFSGSYARAQTASGNRLGFAAPLLYRIAEDVPTAFHDITAGFNGEYAAAPGFDQITGWGSPDIGLLVQALTSDATSPPTPARPPISP
jgi:subtilase family serine protease